MMQYRSVVRWVALGLAIACSTSVVSAAVKLPTTISDNMVLQRDKPVPIWGWADKGEEVAVTLAGQTVSTKAGDNGCWKVQLAKLSVGQPLEMTVKGSSGNTITLKNVLVGDVWICSGQSNMHWTFNGDHGVMNNEAEVAAAKYPDIRMFTVAKGGAPQPAADVKGTWLPITPENLRVDGGNGASALAYFFGRELHQKLGIPIGLINTSVGGTPAEFWTSHEALEANPELKSLAGQNGSSTLYNAMIAPLTHGAICGAIWYQGESNLARAYQYRTLFPAMIADWRKAWGQGDFPFAFVQLAPFRYNGQDAANWAELCEAQQMTLKAAPNTGMAVTVDIGDIANIHPKNKQEVGRRLALWALAKVYGRDVAYSGPMYESMKTEGSKIRINFTNVGGGLVTSDGKAPTEFLIAGKDEKFVPAEAEIDDASVVVYCNTVTKPVAVRFAWRDTAQPNLTNKEGLPASPFRTDTWKGVTEGK